MRNIKQWLMVLHHKPTLRADKNGGGNLAQRTLDFQVSGFAAIKKRVLSFIGAMALVIAVAPGSTFAVTPGIGFQVVPVTLPSSGTPLNATIWYPADISTGGNTNYSFVTSPPINPPVPRLTLIPSPNGAVENSPIIPGSYPTIFILHGGNTGSEATRFDSMVTAEALAAKGFIVVGYRRLVGLPNCSAAARDLSALMDIMRGTPSLPGQVNPSIINAVDSNKMGIRGFSTSGAIALSFLTSGEPAVALNVPRVKAVFLIEPDTGLGCTSAQPVIGDLNIPYMVIDGSTLPGLSDQSSFFAATPLSKPRYRETLQPYAHFFAGTGSCTRTDAYRNQSLQYQQANFPNVIDPYSPGTSYITSGESVLRNDAWGFQAAAAWFNTGAPGLAAGSTCNKSGVGNPIINLDDGNGFTKTPPLFFDPTPNFIDEGTLADILNHHLELAYFKVYLASDTTYQPTLNREFAEANPSTIKAYDVFYNFSGFFSPLKVENTSTLNSVKAGQAIPVKFGLGGNLGMEVLAIGYPQSVGIPCSTAPLVAPVEETVTAVNSGLQYNSVNNLYTYVWKTDKAWKGTCRQLVVKLRDNTTHTANFQFK